MITNRFIYGGIEKFLLEVFKNKSNPNIQYDLLTLTSEKDEALLKSVKNCNVGCYCLELDKHHFLERQIYHYKSLYTFIKQNNYDVVHINITSYMRVFDMLIVKYCGVKRRIIHSHSANEILPFSRKILRPMRKLYDYTATDYFACSENAAKYLFSKKIYNKKKYVIIQNGIDVIKYKFSDTIRNQTRNILGLDKAKLLIGHIGRLTAAKNHYFLLEIFNEICKINPNAMLLLVGDGELKGEIENRIHKLKINKNIIMYGATSDVSSLLSAMDIFLFPSKWEGLGIAIIEAQCNGLPCYISENVPSAAIITDNVRQYNVEEGAKWWAKMILDENNTRVDQIKKLEQSNWNISYTISQLEVIYTKN